MNKLKSLKNYPLFLILLGAILGFVVMASIRVATYEVPHTHFHANFAVYINGERELFKSPSYYQEVAICKVGHEISNPIERTHMHDENNGLIHVHDHAVTWGNFFENIGWAIGPDFIVTNKDVIYKADDSNKLNIYINGQDYTNLSSITNMVINDQDRLLVSYGDIDSQTIQKEIQTIPSDAKKADESKDPATCATRESVPFKERLHHIF